MLRKFLAKHRLLAEQYDADTLIAAFHGEMDRGLAGEPSSLAMIPSFVSLPSAPPADSSVIVLDAGGTNLRAALVRFGRDSSPAIVSFSNARMPGIDREVSSDEFFGVIAGQIAPLLRESRRLGFCFSYPASIDRQRDGTLLYWTKEIKAPQVVGHKVLASLAAALRKRNLPVPAAMLVLNDTVASLMAGAAAVRFSPLCTYVGFILGTGTNTSYLESNAHIAKEKGLPAGIQAINVESANFGRILRGGIDEAFDATTSSPGKYLLEKMVSGAYLGPLCTAALRAAASEGVLSGAAAGFLKKPGGLETREISLVMNKSFGLPPEDADAMAAIAESIVERAAKLTAINLAAAILRSAENSPAARSVCVSADGSVYFKLSSFRERAEKHLAGIMAPHGTGYTIVNVENAPVIGAAVAACA